MKAIILAAGVGKRLRSHLGDRPKCLLQLGGRSLLERLLDGLEAAGVKEAVVVVGHRHEEVRQVVAAWGGKLPVRFVFNPDYEKGAILSLWSARHAFDDDVLVMDADVLCSREMISRLVRSPHRNCFLLDGRVEGSGEEQMLMARRGRVWHIARRAESGYDTVGESVGFLKVARESAPALLEALRECLDQGRDRIEHEEAYPIFLRREPVGYERVDDLPWSEIDFAEDVLHAEKNVLPLIESAE